METELRITSRDFDLPEWADTLIRDRAAGLDDLHPKLIGCQVTVQGPPAHHGRAGYEVHIKAEVSPKPLVVNHQHDDNLAFAIDQAFDAMARRLNDDIAKRRGR